MMLLILGILISIIGYISLRVWLVRMRRKQTFIYAKKLAGNITIEQRSWLEHADQHKYKSIHAIINHYFKLNTKHIRRDLLVVCDEMLLGFNFFKSKEKEEEIDKDVSKKDSPILGVDSGVTPPSVKVILSKRLDTNKLREDAKCANARPIKELDGIDEECKNPFSGRHKTEAELERELAKSEEVKVNEA